MNSCTHCNSKVLYILANGYIKCAKCKKKYSPKKIELEEELIEYFCKDINSLQSSKLLNLNYTTVHKRYFKYKELIINYLHNENSCIVEQKDTIYDEYTYLKSSNIYETQNFLTFANKNIVFNLMLPNLAKFKHYGNSKDEIDKFLFLNKIAKIKSKNSIIKSFWEFFEEFLNKFKGIDKKSFIYYLKECEFKFNYTKDEQEKILKTLVFKS